MNDLNRQMGNMQLARPGTPPAQGTYTGSAPPVQRKKHRPHQFSPGFRGKKLDGHYGTGQPEQMPGGRRRRRKSRRKSRKKKRKSRKGKKKRKTRRKKKSRRRRR